MDHSYFALVPPHMKSLAPLCYPIVVLSEKSKSQRLGVLPTLATRGKPCSTLVIA